MTSADDGEGEEFRSAIFLDNIRPPAQPETANVNEPGARLIEFFKQPPFAIV